MLVSLQQFKEDYRMLDEACRQWYDFIKEDQSRADGIGFSKFYDELCEQKYDEYRKNPEDFYEFKPSYPVFISLNKEQTETLAEVIAETLCGYNEPQKEKILSELSNRLDGIIENKQSIDMAMQEPQ